MKLVAAFFTLAALFFWQPAFSATPDQIHKVATGGKVQYSANVKTMKYHKPDCKFYNCRDCTKFFKSPKEAEHSGYKQCKVC